MAGVFEKLVLGFETGDFNKFEKSIATGTEKAFRKFGGLIGGGAGRAGDDKEQKKTTGGIIKMGAIMGASFAVTNAALKFISTSLMDFPMVVSIMKLIKLILMIALLPLMPILASVAEKLGDFAGWLSDNPKMQNVLTGIAGTIAAIWALQKSWMFLKWLGGLAGLAGGTGIAGMLGGLSAAGILSAITGVFLPVVALLAASFAGFKFGQWLASTRFGDWLRTTNFGGWLTDLSTSVRGFLGLETKAPERPTHGSPEDRARVERAMKSMMPPEVAEEYRQMHEASRKNSVAVKENTSVFVDGSDDITRAYNKMIEAGHSMEDAFKTLSRTFGDATTIWAQSQLEFQNAAMAIGALSQEARGWSAGYFYGMTPEMSTAASSALTPGGFGTATKAYDPSNYGIGSRSKYSGGAFGKGGTGGLGGIAGTGSSSGGGGGGGKYYQLGGMVSEEGLAYLHKGERVFSATEGGGGGRGGGGGGPAINININNPVVKEEMDIRKLTRQISLALRNEQKRYVNYGNYSL